VASVVVLPDPVGPVTRNSPRGRRHSARTIGGRPISSNVRMREGISRSTIEMLPF